MNHPRTPFVYVRARAFELILVRHKFGHLIYSTLAHLINMSECSVSCHWHVVRSARAHNSKQSSNGNNWARLLSQRVEIQYEPVISSSNLGLLPNSIDMHNLYLTQTWFVQSLFTFIFYFSITQLILSLLNRRISTSTIKGERKCIVLIQHIRCAYHPLDNQNCRNGLQRRPPTKPKYEPVFFSPFL